MKLTWGWWWHCRDSELFTAAGIPQTSLTGNMVSLETVTQPLSSTKAVWGKGDVK